MGDHNLIQHIFINLIGNAKEAMPSGGDLTIETKEIKEENNRCWESRVKDSGPGIPEENLSKLFDPFFTTKPPGEGTGLGLSVAFGVIETHGGNWGANGKISVIVCHHVET
jgi:signal transduction histidine kinase